MSELRPTTMCGLFKPGHTPHWIQIGKAAEDRDDPPVSGRVLGLHSARSVVVAVDGREFTLWNHVCERLISAATVAGGTIEYQPRWGLLWVPSTNGRFAFCVARSRDDFVDCPDAPPVGRPSELLRSAGGFTVTLTNESSG
jgi:hypothetical protein